MPEILTPQQVAEYLQMSTDTVYRLIRQRKLAAFQIGRDYRIPKEDLTSFLLAHSTREDVRSRMFKQVLAIADRNPGLDSDNVLDELEEMEELAKAKPVAG